MAGSDPTKVVATVFLHYNELRLNSENFPAFGVTLRDSYVAECSPTNAVPVGHINLLRNGGIEDHYLQLEYLNEAQLRSSEDAISYAKVLLTGTSDEAAALHDTVYWPEPEPPRNYTIPSAT